MYWIAQVSVGLVVLIASLLPVVLNSSTRSSISTPSLPDRRQEAFRKVIMTKRDSNSVPPIQQDRQEIVSDTIIRPIQKVKKSHSFHRRLEQLPSQSRLQLIQALMEPQQETMDFRPVGTPMSTTTQHQQAEDHSVQQSHQSQPMEQTTTIQPPPSHSIPSLDL